MTNKNNSITEFRSQIKTEIMEKKEVFNALAQNTFKGLEPKNIPQALLEGMMRGFTLQDFMTKKVYAIGFWNGKEQKQDYSLVTSIDHARGVAMESGQSGKSAPTYTDIKQDGKSKIETCSVTVWKDGGDERGYTATVYFDEYEKPAYKKKDGTEVPGMWQTKPRTMIAKVAEMHALRMAFPKQMAQMYVEEEFEKEHVIHVDADAQVVDEEEKKSAIDVISKEKKVEELVAFFESLDSDLRKDDDVIEAFNARKAELKKPAPKKETKDA